MHLALTALSQPFDSIYMQGGKSWFVKCLYDLSLTTLFLKKFTILSKKSHDLTFYLFSIVNLSDLLGIIIFFQIFQRHQTVFLLNAEVEMGVG